MCVGVCCATECDGLWEGSTRGCECGRVCVCVGGVVCFCVVEWVYCVCVLPLKVCPGLEPLR